MKLEIAAILLSFVPAARASHGPPRRTAAATPREMIAPALDRSRAVDLVPIRSEGGRSEAPRRSKPPAAPPLAPRTAAKRFVVWMQEMGFDGERPWSDGPRGASNGIWDLYLWHCDDTNVQPVPDNMFGEALGAIIKTRQVRDRSTGKLRRLMHYTIPPLPEAVEAPRRERLKRAA